MKMHNKLILGLGLSVLSMGALISCKANKPMINNDTTLELCPTRDLNGMKDLINKIYGFEISFSYEDNLYLQSVAYDTKEGLYVSLEDTIGYSDYYPGAAIAYGIDDGVNQYIYYSITGKPSKELIKNALKNDKMFLDIGLEDKISGAIDDSGELNNTEWFLPESLITVYEALNGKGTDTLLPHEVEFSYKNDGYLGILDLNDDYSITTDYKSFMMVEDNENRINITFDNKKVLNKIKNAVKDVKLLESADALEEQADIEVENAYQKMLDYLEKHPELMK